MCVPGWYGSCGTYSNGSVHAPTPETCCGNWNASDAEALLDATTDAVVKVLEAFEAKGKTPVLSIQQDVSSQTRRFQSRVIPALQKHGGVVMMKALCQTGVGPYAPESSTCTIDGVEASAKHCCENQILWLRPVSGGDAAHGAWLVRRGA